MHLNTNDCVICHRLTVISTWTLSTLNCKQLGRVRGGSCANRKPTHDFPILPGVLPGGCPDHRHISSSLETMWTIKRPWRCLSCSLVQKAKCFLGDNSDPAVTVTSTKSSIDLRPVRRDNMFAIFRLNFLLLKLFKLHILRLESNFNKP